MSKPPIKQSARRTNTAATIVLSASLALAGLGMVRDKLLSASNKQTITANERTSELENKIKHDLAQANKIPAGLPRFNILHKFASTRMDEAIPKSSDEKRQYARFISDYLIRAAVIEHAKLPPVQRENYDGLIRDLFDRHDRLLEMQQYKPLRRDKPTIENNSRIFARKRV